MGIAERGMVLSKEQVGMKICMLGAGVILGTKIKRLQRDTYWKEMPMLGNVTPAA